MKIEIYSIVFMTLHLTLESALSIGTGEKETIVLDSEGKPYIPATSLAGVIRHGMPKEMGDQLFGWISTERLNQEQSIPTRINMRNAYVDKEYSKDKKRITECPYKLVYRECVKLNKYHTADGKMKYTILAVDRGAKFKAHIEMKFESLEQEKQLMNALTDVLFRMNEGEITLGHKSMRGFGKVSIRCTGKRYCREDSAAPLIASLDHQEDMELPYKLAKLTKEAKEAFEKMEFDIQIRDTLCVREYAPVTYADKGTDSPPAYVQLTSGENAVIPGTSWAGMFRHAAEAMLTELGLSKERSRACINTLFGYVDEETQSAQISHVRFEDTVFVNTSRDEYTRGRRTAINRASGGAANGALYAEGVLAEQGEKTEGKLRMYIRKNQEAWGKDLLLMLVRELNEGRLHIGGNGSIGRGMIRVKTKLGDDPYTELAKMIRDEPKKGGEPV